MARNVWKLPYFPIMLGYSWEYIFLPQKTITKSLTTTQVISNNDQGIGKWGFPDGDDAVVSWHGRGGAELSIHGKFRRLPSR